MISGPQWLGDEGMLSSAAYARKYSVNPNTVGKWAACGRINGHKEGAVWRVADEPPPPSRVISARDRTSNGRVKCGTCRRYRHAKEYTVSSLAKGRCRECVNFLERKRHGCTSPETISHGIDVGILQWLESASQDIKDDRKRKLLEHTARIEAMGLQGNGKDWTDGEGS